MSTSPIAHESISLFSSAEASGRVQCNGGTDKKVSRLQIKVHMTVVFPWETTWLGHEGLLTPGADCEARGTPCVEAVG